MPVTAKGVSGVILSVGSAAFISSPGGPFAFRQRRHECNTCLIVRRARSIQNSSHSSDRIMRTPKRWRWIWVCKISNSVKRCYPSKSNVWRCSRESFANCIPPPRRIPRPRRGWILVSSSHLGVTCSLVVPWIPQRSIQLARLVSIKTVPPQVPRPSN